MSWKMSKKAWLGTATGVPVLALLFLLLRPAPVDVETATVESGPLMVSIDDQGETRSHDRFVVSAPVTGRLMRIELHAGDAVTEGQMLAQMAPLPLSAREQDEITERVKAAEAQQREASEHVRHAQADLAQAQREHARVQKLVQNGFIAPQGAEQAANAATTAAIEAEAARLRAQSAAAEVRVARAGLVAVRGRGAGSDALVPVLAPMAGRILQLPDPSERVVTAGAPLMALGNLDKLEIVIELLSSEAVKVQPGMPVLVEGWGGAQALRARVQRVEPYAMTKVSALGVEEKRTRVIADLLDTPGALGDGYRVTARVVVWQHDHVLKAPSSALFRCRDGWCVFTAEGGEAHRRVVEIGARNAQEAQITKGLQSGQTVIRFPGNQVRDGVRVRPRA